MAIRRVVSDWSSCRRAGFVSGLATIEKTEATPGVPFGTVASACESRTVLLRWWLRRYSRPTPMAMGARSAPNDGPSCVLRITGVVIGTMAISADHLPELTEEEKLELPLIEGLLDAALKSDGFVENLDTTREITWEGHGPYRAEVWQAIARRYSDKGWRVSELVGKWLTVTK